MSTWLPPGKASFAALYGYTDDFCGQNKAIGKANREMLMVKAGIITNSYKTYQ